MSGIDAEARARQAHVRRLIEAGESVQPEESYVPDQAALAAMARDPSTQHGSRGHNSRSPSSSRNDDASPAAGAAAPAASAPSDIDLHFQKQDIAEMPQVRSAVPSKPSTLAQQLQLARGGLDDSSAFPKSASMQVYKYTVYMPHEEGSMVQIATMATTTAHELVKEALRACVEENGGELPVGLLADAWSYRVYVAEEDGEVDTDFPPLDARANVASLGADTFVLRDRVDAALPSAAVEGRSAAPSVVAPEGDGKDHSKTNAPQRGRGFKTLETEGEEDEQHRGAGGGGGKKGQQSSGAPAEAQPGCCEKCCIQ